MAAAEKPNTARTFVKEGPNGERLTRSVTSPQAEVQAQYDGFAEETSAAKSTGGGGRSSSSSGSASSSS